MSSLAFAARVGVSRQAAQRSWDDDALVEAVLPLFGVGPALVIGSDADHLTGMLRGRAVPTTRLDETDLTALPFKDGLFRAVIVCDALEQAPADALGEIARELHRVSGRYLFVRVTTKATGAGAPITTQWARQPWEDCFLQAGFMRHPLGFDVTSYEALEYEGPRILLTFERLPAGVQHRFSLAELKAERNLHMDMLRESGRRADAHIARYHLAAHFVRPGDRVLDAACGLGYGSAVLHDATLAQSVEGLDNSTFAVEYCRSECGAHRPRTSFVCGDITDLERRETNSVDVVVSFETMEHIEDPGAFVRTVARLLTPGGRFICSVPNRWVDETGTDPNPYHLHVFDRKKLLAVCGQFLRFEQLYGQTAGNGFKKTEQRRLLTPVSLSDRDADPEWWVLVAIKPPDPDARDARIAALTRALIRSAVLDPRGFVVFGAGQGGRNAIARLQSLGAYVSCVVDNNEAAWGTVVDRVRVLSPARLRTQPFALIVVASSVGRHAIEDQLVAMGFTAGEHFVEAEALS
jgi:2-polyprenyl-3-methyl-5-hydroxy-6-metoxy-1,4-benzoquinol methylase